MKLAAAAVAACLLAAPPPVAAADCATDADRLRAHLETADRNTSRWQLAWTITFGVAAAGQLTFALLEVDPLFRGEFTTATRDTLYVGTTKATIALGSRLFSPLRVRMPPRDVDRCVELAALRKEIARVGKKERQNFWLSHTGGMILNLAASGLLWYRHSFKDGALSFAYSYPVGVLSTYTMPRASWKLWRSEGPTWGVTVAPTPDAMTLAIGGTF